MVNYCAGISRDDPQDYYTDRERIMEHYGEPFASDIKCTVTGIRTNFSWQGSP